VPHVRHNPFPGQHNPYRYCLCSTLPSPELTITCCAQRLKFQAQKAAGLNAPDLSNTGGWSSTARVSFGGIQALHCTYNDILLLALCCCGNSLYPCWCHPL